MLPLLLALGWFGCTAAGSVGVFVFAPAGLALLALGVASGYGAVATSLWEPGGGRSR